MTKLQFIALLTPAVGSFVLVILAWLHSNSRLSDLRSAISERFDSVNRQFDEVNRRLTLIEADQKQFYAVTGKLDGRLDEISKR